MTAVAPFSKGVTEAAARGWEPISANFLMPQWVKSHWPKYVEGCERGGRPGRSRELAGGEKHFRRRRRQDGEAYATAPNSPYRFYYNSLVTKLKKNGRAELFKTSRDMPDDAVTTDMVCNELVIHGSPQKVADQLLAFRDQIGDFGTLLYAGKDWLDRDLGRRSMILLAEKVLPLVNSAISSGSAKAQAAE